MIFKKKCIICNKNEDIVSVPKYGIYGEVRWSKYHFHPQCLKMVCDAPEEWGHKTVDKALNVLGCIDHWEKKRIDGEIAREKLLKMLCHYVGE